MNGDSLPTGAHVLRYAPPSKVAIPGSAFVRRASDTDGLSVNQPDHYPGMREAQVDQIRRVIHCEVRRNGRFFEISVDASAAHVAAHIADIALIAIEDALEAEPPKYPHRDPSHALITGTPAYDDPLAEHIGDLMAQCIIKPDYPGLL